VDLLLGCLLAALAAHLQANPDKVLKLINTILGNLYRMPYQKAIVLPIRKIWLLRHKRSLNHLLIS
jgi:hypothetical protein